MRVRARLTTAVVGLVGALAMAASLSGCITVHGEEAIVPTATPEEAERALERFVEVSNDANRTYDPELNERIERGPMGAIDHAVLEAQREVNPDGNDDFTPMELSDPTFHIPQQAGWPRFFLADAVHEASKNHWLLVFTRDSVDENWRASYLAALPPGGVPEFAEDEDGHLEDMPVGQAYPGLAAEPRELSAGYAGYLQEEEGPFVDGPFTTGILEGRDTENSDPAYEMHYQDEEATEREYAPVAVRTADGGAMVMFTTHHFDRQTVAPGFTPSVDPLVEALMEGTPETSVTRTWVAMETALVPEGEGDATIINRFSGVVSAEGE
jgi:hypothetical protein